MHGSRAPEPLSEDTCRQVIRTLIERYNWTLLSEEDLLDRIRTMPIQDCASGLTRCIKNKFMLTLYEACHPASPLTRREQGYTELYRFLYRAASQRWPDQSDDVAQQALLMVYEQFDRCREPVAFLAFALGRLRWAYQCETRRVPDDVAAVPVDLADVFTETHATLDDPLVDQERCQVLSSALHMLPNHQQQVVILKFFHDMSDQAISQRLNVSAGNVRVMRHRALQQLRQHQALRAYLELA